LNLSVITATSASSILGVFLRNSTKAVASSVYAGYPMFEAPASGAVPAGFNSPVNNVIISFITKWG
jgi:hypothetical protein